MSSISSFKTSSNYLRITSNAPARNDRGCFLLLFSSLLTIFTSITDMGDTISRTGDGTMLIFNKLNKVPPTKTRGGYCVND